jgi:hypothetical protein
MKMTLTWAERCEKFDDGEIVTNAKIQQAMQEEIDELRKELALQKLSDIGQEIEQTELQALVKSFFEDYLNYEEESDSGRVFNPIHISCTRAMMIEPLAELLMRMKELSGVKE